MKPYAELLEFNQPNPIRLEGFTRIRDSFPGLSDRLDFEPKASLDSREPFYPFDPERIMEFSGRWDYGENNARKLGETSSTTRLVDYENGDKEKPVYESVDVPIIQKYLAMGHESMIEMGDATFFIECSRVVSHELVRHRLVSYQQESQRFVKYDGVDDGIFYFPDGLDEVEMIEAELHDDGSECDSAVYAPDGFKGAYDVAIGTYKMLREAGVAPQLARYVLPNAMRTRLVMKANVREWRHIIGLRLDKSAQPEMQELMQQVYDQLVMVFPNALHGVLDNGRGIR
jgi:thymidylate synthase (FAD)